MEKARKRGVGGRRWWWRWRERGVVKEEEEGGDVTERRRGRGDGRLRLSSGVLLLEIVERDAEAKKQLAMDIFVVAAALVVRVVFVFAVVVSSSSSPPSLVSDEFFFDYHLVFYSLEREKKAIGLFRYFGVLQISLY